MKFRPMSIVRWTMPALLCLGLPGLSGCTHRYHPQFAHALGSGSAIGKGPGSNQIGKRRGIARHEAGDPLRERASTSSESTSGVFGSAPKKSAKNKKSSGAESPFGASSTQPRKQSGVFQSESRGSGLGNRGSALGKSNPLKGF